MFCLKRSASQQDNIEGRGGSVVAGAGSVEEYDLKWFMMFRIKMILKMMILRNDDIEKWWYWEMKILRNDDIEKWWYREMMISRNGDIEKWWYWEMLILRNKTK